MSLETTSRPRGPYSLRLSARLASDTTRRFRGGRLDALLPGGELVSAWQLRDGTVVLRGESERGLERMRFMLGLDDDHSEFLARFGDDPLIGRTTRVLKGLRPPRMATVAQSLLRGLAGQLVTWQQAKEVERTVIRALSRREPHTGLYEPPTQEVLAARSTADLRRLGLHARRAAALVRLCRTLDLERLRAVPTDAVVDRLCREPGLGPWSAAVVCLQGLGRYEHGLVGDLGLVKLLSSGGRRVETEETARLLEPYGEWAGLASVYLLKGMSRGLVAFPEAA
jgi:3-methyladenine DNA glycosylase/8-oxoguanine DNA glycosylase